MIALFLKKELVLVVLVVEMIQPSRWVMFWWNEAVEVIEVIEVIEAIEAVEVIEAADVPDCREIIQ